MTVTPFRGLSARGIIKDQSPYDLTPDAWSDGNNVWFEDMKVVRAPVVRTVNDLFSSVPWACWTRPSSTGYDQVHYQDNMGNLHSLFSGTTLAINPASGFTPSPLSLSTMATFLGDVTYQNNPQFVPTYYGPSSTVYAYLPGWDSTWRCRSLRAFGDYLVALNITKGAATIDNLVKWSDLALDGLPPASWDSTDPTTNAGENPLEALTSPIVDGMPLRDSFIIYSANQVVLMQQTGDQSIFAFHTLYNDGGMIAPNCAVEVEGIHYVFGPDDIYRHDGTGSGKQSLVNRRNRNAIYRNLNPTLAEACFVAYLPSYKKVLFGYPDGSASATFPVLTNYCNRAAVYDLAGDTWSFMDLPNSSGFCLANLSTSVSWASLPGTWSSIGGTWWDLASGFDRHPITVSAQGSTFTSNRLGALDYMNKGSLPLPYLAELNGPVYVERDGIDLDQEGANVGTYKIIRRMFPLAAVFATVPITVQWGGSLTPGGQITWTGTHTFDASTQYKIDDRAGGRFLSVKFTMAGVADMEFSGFDVDVTSAGTR